MTNFHTHTVRCKHAQNSDDEYVCAALEAGYDVFGFADHCPWPYTNGFVSNIRMSVDQLDEYLTSIRTLRDKYTGRISLHVGLECEYFPAYLDWLKSTIDKKHIPYVILGNHHDLTDDGGFYFGISCTAEHIKTYTERTVAGMRTGIFSYLAHPDVVMRGYPEFDQACEDMACAICETALEMHMPLEYNLMGNEYKKVYHPEWKGAGYPNKHFWKVAAAKGCTAIIGLDSHKSDHVRHKEDYWTAVSFLNSLGIKRADMIPFRYDD